MSNDSSVQDTVSTAIKERLTSRFGAAAIFAWCAWNYKFLVVVFSESGFDKKLSYISSAIYPDDWVLSCHFAIAPLCSAFLYVVVHALGEATSKSFDKIWKASWSKALHWVAKHEYVPIDELTAYKATLEEDKVRLQKERDSYQSRCSLFESSFHAYADRYEQAIERYVPRILEDGAIDKTKINIVHPGPGYTFPKPAREEQLKKYGIPLTWIEVLYRNMDSDVFEPQNELMAAMQPLGPHIALDVLVYFGIVDVVPNMWSAINFRVNKAALLPLVSEIKPMAP